MRVGVSREKHTMKEEPDSERICLECGGFCCKLGGVVASRNEVKAILAQGYPNHFIRLADDVYGHDWGSDGTCPYFKNGQCSIYSLRPLGCRMFPVVHTSSTDIVLVECPLACFLSKDELQLRKKLLMECPDHIIRESRLLREEHRHELELRSTRYRHRKL